MATTPTILAHARLRPPAASSNGYSGPKTLSGLVVKSVRPCPLRMWSATERYVIESGDSNGACRVAITTSAAASNGAISSVHARQPVVRCLRTSRGRSQLPAHADYGARRAFCAAQPCSARSRTRRQGVHAAGRGRRPVCRGARCRACRRRPDGRDRVVLRPLDGVARRCRAGVRHGAVRRRSPPRQRGEPGRVGTP